MKRPTKIKITHIKGDTLRELCERIWQDPYMYIHVAKFNGLNKFRHLDGNGELLFPPLVEP